MKPLGIVVPIGSTPKLLLDLQSARTRRRQRGMRGRIAA